MIVTLQRGAFLTAVAALYFGALVSGGVAAETVLLDGVAAYVNANPITIGDVMAMVTPVRRQLLGAYSGKELAAKSRQAYADALDALIAKRLILDVQEKMQADKKGIKIPDWLVEQRVDEIVHEGFTDDRAALMAALSNDRVTFQEWKRTVSEQLSISYVRQMHVDEKVRIPPLAVRRAYDEHPEQYKVPAKMRLRMIVLGKGGSSEAAAARRREADDIRKRAANGEDFAALARQVSQDKRAKDGGDWGWVEGRLLRQELAKAADQLKAGEVSDIIETGEDFYILKVEARQSETTATFVAVAPKVERELRKKQAEQLYATWLARLKADACIKVFDVDLFAAQ